MPRFVPVKKEKGLNDCPRYSWVNSTFNSFLRQVEYMNIMFVPTMVRNEIEWNMKEKEKERDLPDCLERTIM